MKNYWKFIGLMLALQFTFAINASADTAATKKAILAKYQFLGKAYKSKNLADVEAQFAADLTVKHKNRTMNRAEYVTMQRALFSAIAKVHAANYNIKKITPGQNRAVIVVSQYYDFELHDEQGRSHRFRESSVCRDTWVRVSGQWKLNLTEYVSGSATMDGKKMED